MGRPQILESADRMRIINPYRFATSGGTIPGNGVVARENAVQFWIVNVNDAPVDSELYYDSLYNSAEWLVVGNYIYARDGNNLVREDMTIGSGSRQTIFTDGGSSWGIQGIHYHAASDYVYFTHFDHGVAAQLKRFLHSEATPAVSEYAADNSARVVYYGYRADPDNDRIYLSRYSNTIDEYEFDNPATLIRSIGGLGFSPNASTQMRTTASGRLWILSSTPTNSSLYYKDPSDASFTSYRNVHGDFGYDGTARMDLDLDDSGLYIIKNQGGACQLRRYVLDNGADPGTLIYDVLSNLWELQVVP